MSGTNSGTTLNYVNLMDSTTGAVGIINSKSKQFTIPANKATSLIVTNIKNPNSISFRVGLRVASASTDVGYGMTLSSHTENITLNKTLDADTDVSCIYVEKSGTTWEGVEFYVKLIVDGIRYL